MEDSAPVLNRRLGTLLLVISYFIACQNPGTDQHEIVPPQTDSALANAAKSGSVFVYDSTKRYIYITLDDGPQNGTMNCYHLLKNLQVKGSFFMIGVQVYDEHIQHKVDSIRKEYPQMVICNHSYTHANKNRYTSYYGNADSAYRDIEKNERRLNLTNRLFRTPGNNSWAINGRIRSPHLTKSLSRYLDSTGYKLAGWDVEWHFKSRPGYIPVESAEKIAEDIENCFKYNDNFTRNHVVLLAHDRMFAEQQYADSLKKVILLLKKDSRNIFETIDHYPGIFGK